MILSSFISLLCIETTKFILRWTSSNYHSIWWYWCQFNYYLLTDRQHTTLECCHNLRHLTWSTLILETWSKVNICKHWQANGMSGWLIVSLIRLLWLFMEQCKKYFNYLWRTVFQLFCFMNKNSSLLFSMLIFNLNKNNSLKYIYKLDLRWCLNFSVKRCAKIN